MPFSRAIVWRASIISKLFVLLMACSPGDGLLLGLLLRARRRTHRFGCGTPLEHGAGLGDLVVRNGMAGDGDPPGLVAVGGVEGSRDPALAVHLGRGLHRDGRADEAEEVGRGTQRSLQPRARDLERVAAGD